MRLRVVLADDSLLFREGLARLLMESGVEVLAQTGNPGQLLSAVRTHEPDMAVVDIRMPPTHTTEGLDAAAEIKRVQPGIGVLVLSQYLETYAAIRVLTSGPGGLGYLLKERVSDLRQFAQAVHRVAAGELVLDQLVVERMVARRRADEPLAALTSREREVLSLMAEGRSNRAICDQLWLGAKTVETHVRSIFSKLELASTADDHRRVLAVLHYLRS
ncbi:MAG: response regulator transcription factor [Candidatus Dormibacter sp.]